LRKIGTFRNAGNDDVGDAIETKEVSTRAFSCCWVYRKRSVAAFSLRKTPIDAGALLDTYRENAPSGMPN
jgi:hypothetical protein